MDGWGQQQKGTRRACETISFFSWIISFLHMDEALPIDGCNGCHTSGEVETWNWVDGFSHFHLIMSAYHEILITCSSIIAN